MEINALQSADSIYLLLGTLPSPLKTLWRIKYSEATIETVSVRCRSRVDSRENDVNWDVNSA